MAYMLKFHRTLNPESLDSIDLWCKMVVCISGTPEVVAIQEAPTLEV
jgi:hypothetical protein